jgi:Tfp pilus assembly PilM family ATPase/Tfp pilus assembly protein PilN
MIRRSIGIDVGRSSVRAVQMARMPEGLVLEKTFAMQTRRCTDSMADILRSLATEHGFDRHADAAISVPPHAVSFVEIQTDAAGLQAIQAGQTLGLRNDLPIPVEDAIIYVCSTRMLPKDKYSVLVAAASGEAIREQLQSLSKANMRPVAVDSSLMATHAALATNHPETMIGTTLILCVDESSLTLAVVQDGHLLIVRNIPLYCEEGTQLSAEQIAEIIEREVEITWQKLFGAGPDKSLYIALVSAPRTAGQLAAVIQERIECRILVADPYAKVKRSGDKVNVDFSLCTAEGLALRALAPDSDGRGDFLAAYGRRTCPGARIRKELIVCAAMLAATAALWFLGLFVRLSALESEYSQLKNRIQAVFYQALPQEKNIVDPIAQIQQKLDAFRKESEVFSSFRPGRFSPLETLYALTTHTPKEGNLKFHDLLITPDSVQAMGTCDSFAVVSDWQRRLQQVSGFSVVDIQDQKKDARTGQVQFTLSISASRMER